MRKWYWYAVWFQQDLFVFILTNCVSLREGKQHGSSTNSSIEGGSKKHGGNKNEASHFKSKGWYAKTSKNHKEWGWSKDHNRNKQSNTRTSKNHIYA